MSSLHIVYSTSTGHTEHVIETLIAFLQEKAPSLTIEKQYAEQVKSEDLLRGDVLLLASGTWNTGGSEGQLNIRMHALLKERAKDIDLQKKPCLLISLGDSRYFYTARATEHLTQFILQHNGISAADPLIMVNDPYGQEEKVTKWGEKVLGKISVLSA
ncbi:MAG: flavodoxin domain-containing protein [Candidatus Peregrinibacteria bacterium]